VTHLRKMMLEELQRRNYAACPVTRPMRLGTTTGGANVRDSRTQERSLAADSTI
jgi:hypothetical protein